MRQWEIEQQIQSILCCVVEECQAECHGTHASAKNNKRMKIYFLFKRRWNARREKHTCYYRLLLIPCTYSNSVTQVVGPPGGKETKKLCLIYNTTFLPSTPRFFHLDVFWSCIVQHVRFSAVWVILILIFMCWASLSTGVKKTKENIVSKIIKKKKREEEKKTNQKPNKKKNISFRDCKL